LQIDRTGLKLNFSANSQEQTAAAKAGAWPG